MLNRALDFTEGHSGRIKGWLLCWAGRHDLGEVFSTVGVGHLQCRTCLRAWRM
jgi:hypothetical protein